MADTDLLTIRADQGEAFATVAPSVGGRLAQLEVNGRSLLVSGDHTSHPSMWGSFPMAPWAGRVRHGRFEFRGTVHELRPNLPPHAIHGTTFERPWTVRSTSSDRLELDIELGHERGWPLGGSATQVFRMSERALDCELAVQAGETPIIAEIGWHPWFVKPDALEFAPTAIYPRDHEGIAMGPPVEPHLTDGPFDDCFVNREPVVLHVGDLTLTLTSDCDHWVLYDEPEHATCVEPQSGPPDAFNQQPRRLEAGEELRRTFTLSW